MDAKDRSSKLLVVIGGPTGIGKTEVAIRLAQHFQTEIVCADSRQVYKELNIGVGKPDQEQLAIVRHHLISHASIQHPYSAGHYTTDALNIIYTLFATHDIVVLTGGTGLYIQSVISGFDPMPDVPEEVTKHWMNVWKAGGSQPLIDALSEMDPDYLAQVDQSNHSRLIRAVSVSAHSGKPFSSFHMSREVTRPFRTLCIALDLPRKDLYDRIDGRVQKMIDQGWLAEALDLYPHRHLKALQTVGYKELFQVIDDKITLEQAIPMIQQSTRRYAKRQLTWFRNQGEWNWVHPDNVDDMIRMIKENSVTAPLQS